MAWLQRSVAFLSLTLAGCFSLAALVIAVDPNKTERDQSALIGALILIVPLSAVGIGLTWNLHYQEQQRIYRCFHNLRAEKNGRIRLIEFADRANLTGKKARQFLDQQAVIFESRFDVESTDVVYLFPCESSSSISTKSNSSDIE
jgi:hypothetical protein